mmetsp:Transcript_22707/g.63056  ORF Transcript_22707/g.63056 Transcript_22707/m.63056 type:complete len:213 (-) Transcript_22707:62-700(-)
MRMMSIFMAECNEVMCVVSSEAVPPPAGMILVTWSTAMRSASEVSMLYCAATNRKEAEPSITWTSLSKSVMGSSFATLSIWVLSIRSTGLSLISIICLWAAMCMSCTEAPMVYHPTTSSFGNTFLYWSCRVARKSLSAETVPSSMLHWISNELETSTVSPVWDPSRHPSTGGVSPPAALAFSLVKWSLTLMSTSGWSLNSRPDALCFSSSIS